MSVAELFMKLTWNADAWPNNCRIFFTDIILSIEG
jgi:hypothetical protein